MNNNPLSRVHTMNDLGILVNQHLKGQTHIDKMIKKANQCLWLVIRTLGFDAPVKAKNCIHLNGTVNNRIWLSPMESHRQRHYIRNRESPKKSHKLHSIQPTSNPTRIHRIQGKTGGLQSTTANLSQRNG